MLNTFRSKIKFWSNVALWPVIIAFIAFYGWSFSGQNRQEVKPAITINETEIGQDQVLRNRQELIRYYRNIYKENYDRMSKNLNFDEMAVDRIVNTNLLLLAADELGIKVSEDEVQQTILSFPYFKKNGHFSPTQYQRMLQSMRMTPSQYEASVSQDIKIEKVRTLLGAAAPVTEDELRERYDARNIKINTSFFAFRSNDFREGITLNDADYETYYENNEEEFRVDDQIKVKYLIFEPKKYEKQVDPTEDEIDDYYLENAEKYLQPEQTKASHILIKIGADEAEDKWISAKEELITIKEKIESGQVSFEEMAKEHSDDTTAEQGGDLGFFQKGRMVKPFEDAVWNAEIDDIVGPVKTQFGYHLIKKTDYKKQSIKPIDEIEKEIRNTLVSEKSKELALEHARDAFDKTTEVTTLEDLNKEIQGEIKTSDFFVPGMPPREFGRSPELIDVLNSLEPGIISIPVETYKGVYLFFKSDSKTSYIPQYEDVIDDVKQKAETAKARELADEKAQDVYTVLNSGKPWDTVATEFELETQTTGEFGKTNYIPKVGSDEQLTEKLFKLKVGDISGVHEIRNSYYIFKIDEYKGFNAEDFENQKHEIRKQLLAARQQQTVNSWIENKKIEMKNQGQLIIHQSTDNALEK